VDVFFKTRCRNATAVASCLETIECRNDFARRRDMTLLLLIARANANVYLCSSSYMKQGKDAISLKCY